MAERGIEVRKARIADLPSICAIERVSFIEPWDADIFQQTLEWYPSLFLVAEWNGLVVGFLAGAMEETAAGRYGHICNLAVEPAYRNRGIAQQLVRVLERQFRREGAVSVLLEVRFSNNGARRFYENLGYQQAFLLQSYYSNGEDAIVMIKQLPSA